MFRFQRFYSGIRNTIESASELTAIERSKAIKTADLEDLEDIYEQLQDEHLDNFLLCYTDSFKYPEKQSVFLKVLRDKFVPQLEYKKLGANVPTTILDQIVDYESNHPIISVHDLIEHRFMGNKFIYAVFHPQLGDRVLGYLKIGLDDKIASNVNDLLTKPSTKSDVANFYSIISPHMYLSQLKIGNNLIKNAVNYLKSNYNTKSFYTLSPVPRLTKWMESEQLEFRLQDESYLKKLAATYLQTVKKGKYAACPVANFHLQNGASLFRINTKANMSELGITSSLGIMVNYEYDLKKLAKMAKDYQSTGKIASKINFVS
eukprot:NODE_145_length_17646_cov_0.204536.p4 type:complete len:318 gc:universal NODE_145_length_17646_cov_0.204536:3217-4170(+)